jgi:thymidylate synthase
MPNRLDYDYIELVRDIIRNGEDKGDRTGTGTRSVFGRMFRHKMSDGFPLLTTKHMSLKNIKTELYWFLQGDTNIKFLVERGCNIWNGDAHKHYLQNCGKYGLKPLSMSEFVERIKTNDEFAKVWGELGPIYGKQWRNWDGIDQIQDLIDTLNTNPDSRRMKVNAWNVGKLKEMVLPPCHHGFQCYTSKLTYKERYDIWFQNNSETGILYNPDDTKPIDFDNPNFSRTPERKLSLMWLQRSVDTGLGLPYNIASYGLLLLKLADEVGMVPHEIIGSLGDVHLYQNHIEPIQEQLQREGRSLPTVFVRDGIYSHCDNDDVVLSNYNPHPKIKLPLSN